MRRTTSLTILCAALLVTLSAANAVAQAQRPNIVLILADDLGYETIACNGGESYRTPAIDQMAAAGMRFENAYAHPLCTPSRVALMTGRYNFRNYTSFGELKLSETTFGNLLRDAGYKTLIAGKWQLSYGDFRAPFELGFDEYLLWNFGEQDKGSRYWDPTFYRNGKLLENTKGKFGPDLIADQVADFIQRHRAEPFFVYYPLVLPHDPFIEPPGYERASKAAPEEDQRRFKAMVEYTDRLVGRVNDQLQQLGLSKKTLVIFTGDNGTSRKIRSQFKGRVINGDKGSPTEAGTHTPLIARWDGVIPAGRVNTDLIDFTDFLPTLLDVAGLKATANATLDGRSFAPQLKGRKGQPREWIFCHYDPHWGNFKFSRHAQDKQYKLYHDGRLFDYRRDPLEQTPIVESALSSEQGRARQKLQQVLETLK